MQDRYSNPATAAAPVPGSFSVDLLDAADNSTLDSCNDWEFVSVWTCSFQASPTAAGSYYLVLSALSARVPNGPVSQFELHLQVIPARTF